MSQQSRIANAVARQQAGLPMTRRSKATAAAAAAATRPADQLNSAYINGMVFASRSIVEKMFGLPAADRFVRALNAWVDANPNCFATDLASYVNDLLVLTQAN